ncbi:MAG: nuclear transport factor 2 family protein [Phenylobacterium sp.]|uniref:YybH family protein n=1 Tax=Phenylobacterium sp. TaxID=1871053 RepID=UPI002730CAE2|nr:nuclear transport factor 2 family protein [Phenylobacterium sp.]MDP2010216.1 nuclear transport factor 2 family protein [Phenylobacterium sp.]
MNQADEAAVAKVLDAVAAGLHARDAAAVVAQFSPRAVTFDLAPPLTHGVDAAGLAAWIDTWEGPIDQTWRARTITLSGDLAVCHGLQMIRATTLQGGDHAEWWQRSTICLRRLDGVWKIIHEHSSVPFHMDGSFRAAIDLQP